MFSVSKLSFVLIISEIIVSVSPVSGASLVAQG